MSHDLRTPIHQIDGFARLLLDAHGAALGQGAREYVGRIRKSARHMSQLVVGDLPMLTCDPGLARVVFTNLLSNAFKFTRGRARAIVEVGVVGGRGQPVLFVRDNGAGFDPGYADRLFGVFQRLHPEFEGSGVGLATVQRILHKHGGDIWADAAPNQGATFHFTFGPPRHAVAPSSE